MNSMNGTEPWDAGGNNIEAPVDNDPGETGNNVEKALRIPDGEVRAGGGRLGYDIPTPKGDDPTDHQQGKLDVAGTRRGKRSKAAVHRGPRPSPGNMNSEEEGQDRLTNEGGPVINRPSQPRGGSHGQRGRAH